MTQPSFVRRISSLARFDSSPDHRQPRTGAVVAATLLSAGLSLAADAVLVAVGKFMFPSTKSYVHFRFADYSKLTVLGVMVACIAWPVVTRLTSVPRWVFFRLAILVSAVLLLPDLGLLIQGQSAEAVLVLVAMHVGIALVTYNLLVHLAPVRANARRASRAETVR